MLCFLFPPYLKPSSRVKSQTRRPALWHIQPPLPGPVRERLPSRGRPAGAGATRPPPARCVTWKIPIDERCAAPPFVPQRRELEPGPGRGSAAPSGGAGNESESGQQWESWRPRRCWCGSAPRPAPARSRYSSSRATSSPASGRGAASARCGRAPNPAATGWTSSRSEVRGRGAGTGGPRVPLPPALGGRRSPRAPGQGVFAPQVPQPCEWEGNGRRGNHLAPLGGQRVRGRGQVVTVATSSHHAVRWLHQLFLPVLKFLQIRRTWNPAQITSWKLVADV